MHLASTSKRSLNLKSYPSTSAILESAALFVN
ncbi:hypothetical protein ACHAWC_011019 [Mediolabrus comicus]